MVYGLTGTTNFGNISAFLTLSPDEVSLVSIGLVIGVLFIGMALLFKATAAPFHMWAPDVYEGSPTIVSTFFAVVPKIAILGLFLTFIYVRLLWFSNFLATIINNMLINFYGLSGINCP